MPNMPHMPKGLKDTHAHAHTVSGLQATKQRMQCSLCPCACVHVYVCVCVEVCVFNECAPGSIACTYTLTQVCASTLCPYMAPELLRRVLGVANESLFTWTRVWASTHACIWCRSVPSRTWRRTLRRSSASAPDTVCICALVCVHVQRVHAGGA